MSSIYPWTQVSELLEAASALSPEDRERYLLHVCSDPALREHIKRLLISNDLTIDPHPQPPDAPDDRPVSAIGTHVGPYQLVEELGEGGMGVVYRALRADDQFLRSVAIKLMKGDFRSTFNLMRFRNERQILASLDHRNIARLIDGGTTPQGSPYLVMELVDGQPIDSYCDEHRLSISARLRLFRQACSAVEYAHQHLVIHRDLKPPQRPRHPRRRRQAPRTSASPKSHPDVFPHLVEPTAPLMRMLTPEYARPEQIRGDNITTASDIYSLGVILYELLTGHRPYAPAVDNISALIAAVCTVEPPKPSTVVARTRVTRTPEGATTEITPIHICDARDSNPAKLRSRLEGDLDNILLKALRKEPDRRYSSVEQLASDIQLHLEGQPVTARADTFVYRYNKFIRRHSALVAATFLALFGLILGLTLALREAHIARREKALAERRFNDVRDLAQSNIAELHTAIEQLPGSAQARYLAIQRSLQYLD